MLVVELNQSAPAGDPRGFSQANFTKAVFEGFFGASVAGAAIWICLYHVGPEGELGEREHRKSVRAKVSGNWRFEVDAAKRRDYPDIARGRPICVFARIRPTLFLYRLLMPGDAEHKPASDLLEAEVRPYTARKGNRMRDARLEAAALREAWPTGPLWLVEREKVLALPDCPPDPG